MTWKGTLGRWVLILEFEFIAFKEHQTHPSLGIFSLQNRLEMEWRKRKEWDLLEISDQFYGLESKADIRWYWHYAWGGLGKEDSLYSHHDFVLLLAPTSSGIIWKLSKHHCSRSLSSSFTYWLSLAHCSCCLAILSTAILPYFKA